VARATTFRDADDFRLFLRLFAQEVERHDWRVHTFCLMPNHHHLVLETELWRLSEGMRRLNGVYAQAFNRKHKRWGHLFGERFASWVVESEEHLAAAIEYVLQNPVRAGLVDRAEDWPCRAVGPRKRTLVRAPGRS
jgi:putative transposase